MPIKIRAKNGTDRVNASIMRENSKAEGKINYRSGSAF
jgi:hypothetical protein